jgi:hypothetical protein
MSAVDYRHFQSGWQYAWLTLLNRLGYPPSDREIASFLANDPDALMLAALNGSHETTASILQLRLIQLGLDSPRAGIAVLARPKSRGRPVASMPGVLSSCWRCRVDPRRGDLTLQKRLAARRAPDDTRLGTTRLRVATCYFPQRSTTLPLTHLNRLLI